MQLRKNLQAPAVRFIKALQIIINHMNYQILLSIFISVFLAELGDKTQLATLLFSSKGDVNPWGVFIASSLALVLSTAIAVLAGTLAQEHLKAIPLKLIAGIGFLLLGVWTVVDYYK